MATPKKNTTAAAKPKAVKAAPKAEPVVEEAPKVEETPVEGSLQTIEEALMDTPIEFVEDEEKEEKVEEAKPASGLEEISKKMEDFNKAKEEFCEKVEKNPEKAEELIKTELKKAEALKEEVSNIVNKISRPYTTSWNGLYSDYDF